MFKKLPIFRIEPIESELLEIAIVDEPAIESYFLKFSEQPLKMEFNADKQIIKGAVMIPNQLIYRNDSLGERFVTYDEAGIQKAVSLFFKNGLKMNESHTENHVPIDILESYFAVEGNELNVPAGSWVISAKVEDSILWNRIKENEFSGFSFQSLFSNELLGTQELNFKSENNMNELLDNLKTAVNALLFASETPVIDENAAPAETVPANEVPTVEELKSILDEAINSAKETIFAEVDAKIEAKIAELETKLNGGMTELTTKVEEFSKQPLSTPVTEQVANNNANAGVSPATKFFNK